MLEVVLILPHQEQCGFGRYDDVEFIRDNTEQCGMSYQVIAMQYSIVDS